MVSMQCGECGMSVRLDESVGPARRCPSCGGALEQGADAPVSTALSDLQDGEAPVRFGAYSKAAEAQWEDPAASSTEAASWDDPFEPRVEEQVRRLVKEEAVIDSAVLNVVPPEVEARFRARQRERRRKLVTLVVAAAAVLIGLIAYVMF
jgi:hypothetical protein